MGQLHRILARWCTDRVGLVWWDNSAVGCEDRCCNRRVSHDWVNSVSFSPDGAQMALGSADKGILAVRREDCYRNRRAFAAFL